MTVRVVNIHKDLIEDNEVLFMVDRTTSLGNPFKLENATTRERNKVILQFEEYFNSVVEAYDKNDLDMIEYLNRTNPNVDAMVQYLDKIIETAKYTNVALGCHCLPKRCHAAIIKSYIDSKLPKPAYNTTNENFKITITHNDSEESSKPDPHQKDSVTLTVLKYILTGQD